MNTASKAALMLVRVTGLIQIVLGVFLWAGRLQTLIPLHMVLGLVFVLSLWTLTGLSIRARVPVGQASFAFAWGALTLFFGLVHAQLLPGTNHWIIRVLHLIVGLGAMGLSDGLSRRMSTARPDEPSSSTGEEPPA